MSFYCTMAEENKTIIECREQFSCVEPCDECPAYDIEEDFEEETDESN